MKYFGMFCHGFNDPDGLTPGGVEQVGQTLQALVAALDFSRVERIHVSGSEAPQGVATVNMIADVLRKHKPQVCASIQTPASWEADPRWKQRAYAAAGHAMCDLTILVGHRYWFHKENRYLVALREVFELAPDALILAEELVFGHAVLHDCETGSSQLLC